MVSAQDIIITLQIAVLVMAIVLFYHLLFIAVDIRKVVRRANQVTEQVQDVILKPINMADAFAEWLVDFMEEQKKQQTKQVKTKTKKGKGKKKKK